MLLVKHMDRGGRGGRLGLVLMSRPCRRIGAAAVSIIVHVYVKSVSWATQDQERKGVSFSWAFLWFRTAISVGEIRIEIPEKPEGF
jgi:hypothetical protein